MGRGRAGDFSQAGYQPAGIYGWRKQCLYAVILFILVIVIMNAALTVWILRVLNFNIEGLNMGSITISSSGITVGGKTEVVKTLYASKISSRKSKRLTVSSNKDIIFKSHNLKDDSIENKFRIGDNKIESTCDSFEIRDLDGKSKFKVTDKGVTYGVDEVAYSGKAIFNGSIETPNIRGPYRGSLRMESASSSIIVSGRDRVYFEAPVGNIDLQSSSNIAINADKRIILNSTRIYLPDIVQSPSTINGQPYEDVYQLCLCQNGRLFLAPSTGKCVTEQDFCS